MPFSEATFRFLGELAVHNDRQWFADNKARYHDDVLAPSIELVEALRKPLSRVAPFLVADGRRSGGSVLRIYRDTRFSKDKTPYKTHVGIQLRHDAGKDIHAPSIYLHFEPGESLVAAGCFRPEPPALAAIRRAIDAERSRWKRVRDEKRFRAESTFWGESLKTAPRDYPKDHPMIDDLRRKDFIACFPLSRNQVFGNELVSLVIERIKWSRGYLRFLCDALDVPY